MKLHFEVWTLKPFLYSNFFFSIFKGFYICLCFNKSRKYFKSCIYCVKKYVKDKRLWVNESYGRVLALFQPCVTCCGTLIENGTYRIDHDILITCLIPMHYYCDVYQNSTLSILIFVLSVTILLDILYIVYDF